ncbi:thiamine pyrophosphate-dependent enzyme [Xenorhabdus siamensis]|uniref:thiamine pyrophosphate-dependent enzyme n=1 Tax=Xenorhabdus siamensis TaxID=3136254 RepID=UPI0030F420BA
MKPIIASFFIVFNNASYVASYFNNKDNKTDLTKIPDYDWCQLARGLGLDCLCVNSPDQLQEYIAEIMQQNSPFLIEIKCDSQHTTPNKEYNKRIKAFPLV